MEQELKMGIEQNTTKLNFKDFHKRVEESPYRLAIDVIKEDEEFKTVVDREKGLEVISELLGKVEGQLRILKEKVNSFSNENIEDMIDALDTTRILFEMRIEEIKKEK
jgi:hypothetical protein